MLKSKRFVFIGRRCLQPKRSAVHCRFRGFSVARGVSVDSDRVRHPVHSRGADGKPLARGVLSYERVNGETQQWRSAVVLMHGLFGAKSNLKGLASRLGGDCVLLDLRNHGDSQHCDSMNLQQMAEDLWATLSQMQIGRCHLVGHSLGGRIAMTSLLNCSFAPRIGAAFVLDVAPVDYGLLRLSLLNQTIDTFRKVPLTQRELVRVLLDAGVDADSKALRSEHGIRKLAIRFVKAEVPELSEFEIGWLLSNLVRLRNSDGTVAEEWRWKCNLQSIQAHLREIQEFHSSVKEPVCHNEHVWFIGGADSKYIQPTHRSRMHEYFPNHKLRMIEGASHMLHLDAPDEVVSFIRQGIAEAEASAI